MFTPRAGEIYTVEGGDNRTYYDVCIVGAGPAGLATAIRIKQLAKQVQIPHLIFFHTSLSAPPHAHLVIPTHLSVTNPLDRPPPDSLGPSALHPHPHPHPHPSAE